MEEVVYENVILSNFLLENTVCLLQVDACNFSVCACGVCNYISIFLVLVCYYEYQKYKQRSSYVNLLDRAFLKIQSCILIA